MYSTDVCLWILKLITFSPKFLFIISAKSHFFHSHSKRSFLQISDRIQYGGFIKSITRANCFQFWAPARLPNAHSKSDVSWCCGTSSNALSQLDKSFKKNDTFPLYIDQMKVKRAKKKYSSEKVLHFETFLWIGIKNSPDLMVMILHSVHPTWLCDVIRTSILIQVAPGARQWHNTSSIWQLQDILSRVSVNPSDIKLFFVWNRPFH